MELKLTLISVAMFWSIAVVTPGPNFFITVHTAIGRSRQAALYVVAGICTGTIIWAVCGYVGINLLFKTTPWLYLSLKFFGGAYLIYLGLKLLRSKPMSTENDLSNQSEYTNPLNHFRLGLLTNLSNPKTAAFITSMFAATMPPDASFGTGGIGIALMAFISAIWYASVAFIFSLSRFRNYYQMAKVHIERAAGIVFIGFGLKLSAGR